MNLRTVPGVALEQALRIHVDLVVNPVQDFFAIGGQLLAVGSSGICRQRGDVLVMYVQAEILVSEELFLASVAVKGRSAGHDQVRQVGQ